MSGPVIRYPGSKWRIAEWICAHLPEHETYIEPFFGSGAVFFTKDPSANEIINDLNGEVIHLFKMIREKPEALAALVEFTPWSRDEYVDAVLAMREPATDPMERCRHLLVSSWQSYGSKKFTHMSSWKVRDGSDQNAVVAWKKLPDRILWTAKRLRDAQIENSPALDVIRRYNNPETLLYVDPPYLGNGRALNLYQHEMHRPVEHLQLLEVLKEHIGPVLLSGYHSDLYDSELQTWQRVETQARAQGNAQRTEVLWINPVAWSRLRKAQPALLEVAR